MHSHPLKRVETIIALISAACKLLVRHTQWSSYIVEVFCAYVEDSHLVQSSFTGGKTLAQGQWDIGKTRLSDLITHLSDGLRQNLEHIVYIMSLL